MTTIWGGEEEDEEEAGVHRKKIEGSRWIDFGMRFWGTLVGTRKRKGGRIPRHLV